MNTHYKIPDGLSPEADLYMRMDRILDRLHERGAGLLPGLGRDWREYPHGTLRRLAKQVHRCAERANVRRDYDADRDFEQTLTVWLDLLLPMVPECDREIARRGFWTVFDGEGEV